MEFKTDLKIPANTQKDKPIGEKIWIAKAIIKQVRIGFSPGCLGQAGVRIERGGSPIYPTTAKKWYAWDSHIIKIEDDYNIVEPPFYLQLWGYNTDDTFSHTIEIVINQPGNPQNFLNALNAGVQQVAIPEALKGS